MDRQNPKQSNREMIWVVSPWATLGYILDGLMDEYTDKSKNVEEREV